MLVKNLSCPNQENTNYTYRLPSNTCCASDTLRINFLIGPCDNTTNKSKVIYDKCSKDLKCKIDDKTKGEMKENIKNELKKDLKCEIDDKTKNEMKENIKSELKKDLKCEIDDKTKGEMKENIKNELKKDLKCEIDDKTKNEMKENIKSELKKDLKCEIDDKTKGEMKENIKNELKKDLKCEIDDKTKNEMKENIKSELKKDLKCEIDDKTKGEMKENIKNELKKDLKCEIDDKTKNEMKNKIKDEIKNEIDCKCDQDKTSDEKKDKNKVTDDVSGGAMKGMVITEEHANNKKDCQGGFYRSEGNIDKPAWFTRDLLKQFFPDLMSKKEILDYTNPDPIKQYHATHFAITFECKEDPKCGNAINFTHGSPSGMWCNKKGKIGNAVELCPYKEFLTADKSVCFYDNFFNWKNTFSGNFFLNEKCPNLVLQNNENDLKECSGKTIVAKLVAPLIVADLKSHIIDKDGNNTGINYIRIRPYLNSDGTVKENCKSNAECKEYAKIMDKILWTSDEEIKLKIPDNLGEKSSYSPSVGNNQHEAFSYHGYDNDLI